MLSVFRWALGCHVLAQYVSSVSPGAYLDELKQLYGVGAVVGVWGGKLCKIKWEGKLRPGDISTWGHHDQCEFKEVTSRIAVSRCTSK